MFPVSEKTAAHNSPSDIFLGDAQHISKFQDNHLKYHMNMHFKIHLRMFALKQLKQAGAVLTTSECVIFGLVGDSAHSKFREVQKLIMQSAPSTRLLQAHCSVYSFFFLYKNDFYIHVRVDASFTYTGRHKGQRGAEAHSTMVQRYVVSVFAAEDTLDVNMAGEEGTSYRRRGQGSLTTNGIGVTFSSTRAFPLTNQRRTAQGTRGLGRVMYP
uniref:Ribosomal_L18e/L15P domain-containing protein n=1 Tax=Steinernema glaseri TaxID=37863 RepID=A0A1I8ATK5_9BILA